MAISLAQKEFLANNGYFFACDAAAAEWAKQTGLIDLYDVVKQILPDAEISPGNYFVPTFYSNFNKKELLPVWVWRMLRLSFRHMKRGDIVQIVLENRKDKQPVEVFATVETIREELAEVIVLHTNQMICVELKDIIEINQD